jgi:predicted amidophosphoribosyltransferase
MWNARRVHEKCPVCDLQLPPGRRCPNYWCGRDDRGFDVVWAVGQHRGELRRGIAGLKYRGEQRWVAPLGRLLARFLLDNGPCFDEVDLIVAIPGNVGRTRPVDHTRQILAAADSLIGGLWATDLPAPVITKRAETRPMMSAPSAAVRRIRAAGELRAVLLVTEPEAVRGRRILAVDDVFTDGSTMREVALALRAVGALAVSGLVLARQPLLTSPTAPDQGVFPG